MTNDIKNMIMIVLVLEIILLLYILVMGIVGSFSGSGGCHMRYSFAGEGQQMTESLQTTARVRADGNYSATNYSTEVVNGQARQVRTVSNNNYGRWIKINAYLPNNTSFNLKFVGTISLCRAYLPKYNLWSDSNLATDAHGNTHLIPIPRVEETQVDPLTIAYNAQQAGWRNITQIYPGDAIEVILQDDVAHSGGGSLNTVTIPNVFTYPVADFFPSVDCSDGKQQYSPFCGRWSMWNGKQSYVSKCTLRYGKFPRCGSECCDEDAFGTCWSWFTGNGGCYKKCYSNIAESSSLPVAYSSTNRSLFIPAGTDVNIISKEQCIIKATSNIAQCQSACQSDPSCSITCTNSINTCNTKCTNENNICSSSCIATNSRCLSQCSPDDANCKNSCNNTLSTCQNTCTSAFSSCTSQCSTSNSSCVADCQASSLAQCKDNCDPCVAQCEKNTPSEYTACKNACANAPAVVNACIVNDPQVQACIPLSNTNSFNAAISQYRYWYTATDAGGLVWRLSPTITPTPSLGGNLSQVTFVSQDADPLPDAKKYTRKIYSAISAANSTQYLQYAFNDPKVGRNVNHTGGYVFQLKQTKCRRVNGQAISDEEVQNRGEIQYVITTGNPNINPPSSYSVAHPNPQGEVKNLNSGNESYGYIWLRVHNGDVNANIKDYQDSVGQYVVQLYFNTPTGSFAANILSFLFGFVREKLNAASQTVFANLICYQQTPSSSCLNFFSYVKAILMLYITFYGLMFLSGMVTISQRDLVVRVAKIAVVAGLINGQTFEWFNTYLFDFLTGFTDQMISNMSGFSLVSAANTVSNPFMFLDSIMSKIFFGTTFTAQLMGVLGMGLVGLLYFLIICVGVIVFVIVALRSIAIYVMALVSIAFLISLAPFFLTFMLFEKTFYLFENWCNFLFRYMMEPVILMLGVIILTQLFTLYIDQVLGFSVCWKCAISFSLPFAGMMPFPGLADMPLFCLNWFGPWGIDPSTYQPGMDLVNIIGLIIVCFTAYGWAEFASRISQNLSSANGPGATQMGLNMASASEQKFLRNYGLDSQTRGKLNAQQQQRRQASRDSLKQREKEIAKEEKTLGIQRQEQNKKSLSSGMDSSATKMQGSLPNILNGLGLDNGNQSTSSSGHPPSSSTEYTSKGMKTTQVGNVTAYTNADSNVKTSQQVLKDGTVVTTISSSTSTGPRASTNPPPTDKNSGAPSVDRSTKPAPTVPEKSDAVKQTQADLVKASKEGKATISGPSVDRSTKPTTQPPVKKDTNPD